VCSWSSQWQSNAAPPSWRSSATGSPWSRWADRYRVSRQAVHGWLRRYRTGGLDALADRIPSPR
jgi:hypothetical protein